MTNSFLAETYFITAMMILILVLSITATIFFVRQYKKEKKANPLTRKNLANFQASLKESERTSGQTNKQTSKAANNQTSKQTEYVEK